MYSRAEQCNGNKDCEVTCVTATTCLSGDGAEGSPRCNVLTPGATQALPRLQPSPGLVALTPT